MIADRPQRTQQNEATSRPSPPSSLVSWPRSSRRAHHQRPRRTASDSPRRRRLLRALLEQNAAQAHRLWRSGQSEDMLVDNINEALFDLVGDTVIEFGAAGPQIIEDYEADVRGYLDHE
ncbi:MAG: tellurite resistance TerB C-terminal domain-containing protein [Collinsella sp.]